MKLKPISIDEHVDQILNIIDKETIEKFNNNLWISVSVSVFCYLIQEPIRSYFQ